MPGMLVPEATRHQHLNWPPQKFFPPVSKQPLHLRIDQDDLPLFIHNHHGIWRCFEEPPELRICHQPLRGFTQTFLRFRLVQQ